MRKKELYRFYSVRGNFQVPDGPEEDKWMEWHWDEKVVFESESKDEAVKFLEDKAIVSDDFPIYELFECIVYANWHNDEERIAVKDGNEKDDIRWEEE